MPLYRDEGVVLRTAKLGEADRIVTLLTRSHGKVRAVAKGVRRVKSRFGGRLEPFMRVDVLIATGRTLDVVSQVESISAYAAPICADYGAYGIANVMVETADKLVSAEGERAVAQYRLLVGGLNALARHAHPATAIGNPMCCVRWLWPGGLRGCIHAWCADGMSPSRRSPGRAAMTGAPGKAACRARCSSPRPPAG